MSSKSMTSLSMAMLRVRISWATLTAVSGATAMSVSRLWWSMSSIQGLGSAMSQAKPAPDCLASETSFSMVPQALPLTAQPSIMRPSASMASTIM